MSQVTKLILAANLIVLALLAFAYPQLMVAPGKLIAGHRALDADCFACHAPFTGASADRCVACHKVEDIGRLTTTGKPLAKPLTTVPFHQKLSGRDCIACHSDHAGIKRFGLPGRFKHDLLQAATREQCEACHRAPQNALHRQISGNCRQCHSETGWTPATFDHDKYFVLDRDHQTRCATCHVQNDYSRYTCYGCHEHSRENIRREHVEEGIRNFDDCVECHRDGGEGGEHGEHGEHGHRGRGGEHDDD